MFVILFIPDTMIYSISENENIDHLWIVFKILKDQKFFYRFSKWNVLVNLNNIAW